MLEVVKYFNSRDPHAMVEGLSLSGTPPLPPNSEIHLTRCPTANFLLLTKKKEQRCIYLYQTFATCTARHNIAHMSRASPFPYECALTYSGTLSYATYPHESCAWEQTSIAKHW